MAWPYISLLILTFLNRCISVNTSLINTKLKDFVNLGALFLTMWFANPIIYRLEPSPSRFEVRQCSNSLRIPSYLAHSYKSSTVTFDKGN